MKNLIGIVISASLLSACGNNKTINGVTYSTYGLLNEGNKRNDNIRYEVIPGNVVWSILLSETFVTPLYFLGFSLYQPVGETAHPGVKGAVN